MQSYLFTSLPKLNIFYYDMQRIGNEGLIGDILRRGCARVAA